jgi:cation diffusion facilitator CzcD-associated flavoprotein CzcO
MSKPERRHIVIIGAGPGGLCMGIKLKEAGHQNFVILEKASGVGGTWYHNRYPGAACDVPSALYSFSFEVKHDWSRPFGTQPEILDYMEHCAQKYGLLPHLRLDTPVRAAHWDDVRSLWQVELDSGETLEADIVVSAVGMFNELNWPDIPGLDRFEGTSFHSARWNHDHDLGGERVGVIGSAARAVQLVPEIARRAGQVHVFQRTANWVAPKDDDPFTPEELEAFRSSPALMAERRQATWDNVESMITFDNPDILQHQRDAVMKSLEQVEDPELRKALTPTHPFGCKRPLISNDYYPTFNRSNVELVTDPIREVTASGVVTADGKVREVDTLVIATGFQTTRYLSAIEVTGREGRRLDDAWNDGAQAYLGITTSGFPNLFMLYGPNTNNGAIIWMIECQVAYALRHIERLRSEDLAWLDVRSDVQDAYNESLQRDIDGVEVWQADCNGYYRVGSRIVTQWPHGMAEFKKRTSQADAESFEVGRTGANP